MNIKICPLIKIDKKLLKLKKENFSLLSKKIKKEIIFQFKKVIYRFYQGKNQKKKKIF